MPGAELLLALLGTGAVTGAGGSLATALVGRRLRRAQADQITRTAHAEIYTAYGGILGELRSQIASLRTDLTAAEGRARTAEAEAGALRAEVAELRRRLERHEQREAQLLGELARIDPTSALLRQRP